MNKKFSLTLLAVLIVLLVSLAVTTSFSKAPKSADVGWPPRPNYSHLNEKPRLSAADTQAANDFYQRHPDWISISISPAAAIPLTGAADLSDYSLRHPELSSAAETAGEVQIPRLWSGEVFLSNNDSPDVNIDINQDQQNACIADDSQPRRYGGCAE